MSHVVALRPAPAATLASECPHTNYPEGCFVVRCERQAESLISHASGAQFSSQASRTSPAATPEPPNPSSSVARSMSGATRQASQPLIYFLGRAWLLIERRLDRDEPEHRDHGPVVKTAWWGRNLDYRRPRPTTLSTPYWQWPYDQAHLARHKPRTGCQLPASTYSTGHICGSCWRRRCPNRRRAGAPAGGLIDGSSQEVAG